MNTPSPTHASPMFTERRIPRGEYQIYLRDYAGADPAFVLMHGFPDNLGIYDRLAPLLARAGQRVIAFDFLGYGGSDKPAEHPYTAKNLEGDLEAVVAALGLLDGTSIVDSEMFLRIPALPMSITIVGAGVIGVEYACMTAALGIPTTLVESRDRMLEFVDEEIVEALRYHMRDMAVTFRFGEEVVSVRKTAEGWVIAELKSRKEIRSHALLYSVGRQGNTAELNLEAAGLQADARGRIHVNEHYQSCVPHIYAVGDVIGFPSLASVSMMQGRLAACHAFDVAVSSVPSLFPYGIYTIPEISYVGQNEDQLTQLGVPYEVGIARYREIARGQIIGDQYGMLKLLFHRQTRQLLGVHIIGEGAAELVHIGQAVLSFGGGLDYFLNNVFNYPTLAECYKVAAHSGANKIAPGSIAFSLH
jgi:NAD(P) transhydrogenase